MRKLFMTTAAALTLTGAAFAETAATAATDLNVRSGPGVWHDVVGTLTAGQDTTVLGCIESANWCQVTAGELTGWSYGDYLNVAQGDQVVALYPNRQVVGVTVIEAPATDNTAQNTAVGGATGAAMGALVGGPVGAVAGAVIGGTAGGSATVVAPAEAVTTYVTSHEVAPVILDGEVVVGAGVPDSVTIYDIPDQPDYRYAVINRQTVLVNPDSRQIVYIYR
ncbi:DUF1236 domain-containing protein [Paracoccus sp. (in: a-proteobacteria)]|uniref:DUF1236 domain-containing protein n=1 Tax=Paracoccus sp. TaxID=267 RepID=UPI0026DF04F5|nr:DUF1236 domain-containing protein [Paracoccus sp. (in: a-proteobacteria)]MDO5647333.1 DUF1236 domain-containing protein [Paracoccus sp. (in: a-proteobacteria)]